MKRAHAPVAPCISSTWAGGLLLVLHTVACTSGTDGAERNEPGEVESVLDDGAAGGARDESSRGEDEPSSGAEDEPSSGGEDEPSSGGEGDVIGEQEGAGGGAGTSEGAGLSSIDHPINDLYPGTCGYAIDSEGDGVFDRVGIEERNAEGALLREETDVNADGTIDQFRIVVLGVGGRIEEVQLDIDADGTINGRYVHEYRDDGQVSRDVDYNLAGDVTRTRDYLYDERGFVVEVIENKQADGFGTSSLKYDLDANGCMVAVYQDDGHDLVIDTSSSYQVDASCNTLELRIDYGDDGTVDNTITQTYDADGNELTYTNVDVNGNVASSRVSEYRAGLIVKQTEANAGGVVSVSEWTRNEQGHLLSMEARTEMGQLLERTTYINDVEGRSLSASQDYDGDGTVDYVRLTRYDCE